MTIEERTWKSGVFHGTFLVSWADHGDSEIDQFATATVSTPRYPNGEDALTDCKPDDLREMAQMLIESADDLEHTRGRND